MAPANVMILAGRPQNGPIYGRSHGSEELDCNRSGGMVVTYYLSSGNVLWISFPGGQLIYVSYLTDNGSAGGSGGTMGWTDDG